MNAQSRTPLFRWTVIAATVVTHCALVPVAIGITLKLYGFENALTIHNQTIWTPIINAQSILLVIFVAFGSRNAVVRSGLFSLGLLYVLASLVWARSMLHDFGPDPVRTWIVQLQVTSISLLLPALAAAITLVPLRGIFGAVTAR